MSTSAPEKIPVCNTEGRIIERVAIGSPRAIHLLKAPNATIVRKRHRGEPVRILLISQGDESRLKDKFGDPRAYSHRHETETNPENVWTLKRIPTETADIFGAVVNELAA